MPYCSVNGIRIFYEVAGEGTFKRGFVQEVRGLCESRAA